VPESPGVGARLASSSSEQPALGLRGLSKTFPGTRALAAIDLDLTSGEIHALVGGNGSGKSTLIKVLAGVYQGDHGGGTIEVPGQGAAAACDWEPRHAFAAGLRFVHQNPGIFLDLTVAENLAIGSGFPTDLAGRIRWRALRARARELIDRYHLRAAPDQPLRFLRPADRSMVAIARALQDRERNQRGILVLDEPTTSLPASDVEFLLAALRRYASDGLTILYVSHRIDEVLSLADRVSVLRDGRLVGTVAAAATSEAEVVRMIVGRRLEAGRGWDRAVGGGDALLAVRGLSGGPLRGVDLTLRRGEVLGLAGLLGAGQSELLRMLFGAVPYDSGELMVDGRPRRFRHPSEAMAAGLGYVPSERAAEALFPRMTVRENISSGSIGRYFRGLHLHHREESRDVVAAMREFLIRAASDRAPAFTLSGGNQQKMVLARWLRRRPRILLLDEPTQGVDVGSRQEIYSLLRQAAEAGTSAIVVSSDFGELERLCHRVAVIRRGRLVAELSAPDIDEHRLTELANRSEEAA
jgi:ribose transport system ATP-binding protein